MPDGINLCLSNFSIFSRFSSLSFFSRFLSFSSFSIFSSFLSFSFFSIFSSFQSFTSFSSCSSFSSFFHFKNCQIFKLLNLCSRLQFEMFQTFYFRKNDTFFMVQVFKKLTILLFQNSPEYFLKHFFKNMVSVAVLDLIFCYIYLIF